MFKLSVIYLDSRIQSFECDCEKAFISKHRIKFIRDNIDGEYYPIEGAKFVINLDSVEKK